MRNRGSIKAKPVTAGAARVSRAAAREGLKSKAARAAYAGFHGLGVFRSLRRRLSDSLSVLAYHRITDRDGADFIGLPWNVSASRAQFAAQLDYIKNECTAISLTDLVNVVHGGAPLPPNAVLITFDDGYRDNFTDALPELARRNLPAALFAATGFIDGFTVPFWDVVVEAFLRTNVEAAELPLLGHRRWKTRAERLNIAHAWIRHGIDCVPHCELRRALPLLSAVLGQPPALSAPSGLMMDWDELAVLARSGWEIGAHSVMHAVLLQSGRGRAEREIAISKRVLERRLGRPVNAFAYPNGLFSRQHEAIVAESGYSLAFRVDGGLTFRKEMAARPFAIRRSCITGKDDLPRFAAKVAGLARLSERG